MDNPRATHHLPLTRRQENANVVSFPSDSPKSEFALLRKFLPHNSPDDDDSDPYSADHFRIYDFKVRKCTRTRSHDWTECPFAHPGEKARRRDPRRYNYSGAVCPEFRRGACSRGDNCEFAHGVFEHWLHPDRYRTEACKDGKSCQRKICFFAHTSRQLRILPPDCYENSSSPLNSPLPNRSSPVSFVSPMASHCCGHCHHCSSSFPVSPTSPLSPVRSRLVAGVSSPISRFGDGLIHQVATGGKSYPDAVIELVKSVEVIKLNETIKNLNHSFVDDNQFIPSPSVASYSNFSTGGRIRRSLGDESFMVDPDLGWVNDLLT